jgi:hypothetical protein
VIVQFGGQTPLKIATQLDAYLKKHPVPAASGESADQETAFALGKLAPWLNSTWNVLGW